MNDSTEVPGNEGLTEAVSVALRAAAASLHQALHPQAVFATTATSRGHVMSERADLRDPRWEHIVVRPGRGLGGRVIDEGGPVAVSNYIDDSSITADYLPVVRAEGLRSMACVPVPVEARVEALIYVGFHEVGGAGTRAVDQVRHVAELTGLCLLHSRARGALATQALQALRTDDTVRVRAVAERASQFLAGSEDGVPLTGRQRQVLDLLGVGASNIELAQRLGISEATVKEHVGNLCRKFDATSRLEVVSRARDAGLI